MSLCHLAGLVFHQAREHERAARADKRCKAWCEGAERAGENVRNDHVHGPRQIFRRFAHDHLGLHAVRRGVLACGNESLRIYVEAACLPGTELDRGDRENS